MLLATVRHVARGLRLSAKNHRHLPMAACISLKTGSLLQHGFVSFHDDYAQQVYKELQVVATPGR